MSGIDQRFTGPFEPISLSLHQQLSPLMRRLVFGAEGRWRVRVFCHDTRASWTALYEGATVDDAETHAHADAHALNPRGAYTVQAFEHVPAPCLWELRLRPIGDARSQPAPAVIGHVVAGDAVGAWAAVHRIFFDGEGTAALPVAPQGWELVLLDC